MKKLIVFIFVFLLALNLRAAVESLNVNQIAGEGQSEAESQFEPVLKVIDSGLNSGIFAPLSSKVFSFGIQSDLVSVGNDGVLQNATVKYVDEPFIYAGLRIPGIGVDVFARGIIFTFQGQTTTIYGFGAGYEPAILSIIDTKIVLQYHGIKNLFGIQGNSVGGTAIADLNLIPLITPFITLGLNNISLTAPGVHVFDSTADFSMSKVFFQGGFGVKFLKILIVEMDYLPMPTYSISIGYSF